MKNKINGLLFHVVVLAHSRKLWSQVQKVRHCLQTNTPLTSNPFTGFAGDS